MTPLFSRFALYAVAGGLLASTATPAKADQLIQTPTADRSLGPRLEYKHRVDGTNEGYASAVVPVGLAYELLFRYYNNENGQYRIEGGGQLQLLPDGVITPGVAVGMWDITNSSPWGRRSFLVLTKSLRSGQIGIPEGIDRVQLNFGFGTGRFSGLFASARVDVLKRVSFVTEYDTRRLNVGLWVTPVDAVTLKAELQNGNPYLGGDVTLRF